MKVKLTLFIMLLSGCEMDLVAVGKKREPQAKMCRFRVRAWLSGHPVKDACSLKNLVSVELFLLPIDLRIKLADFIVQTFEFFIDFNL
jgi:hypothetical protein